MFGRHGYYGRARAVALVTASFITCGITALQVATAEPGVDKEQILIGAFGPLTGPASWIGLGARDGMQLAVDEINANGGVNGRKIRLQFEGAQTPAESVAAVKKLVEQNEVFGLVLGSGSTGAAAAADYLREAQVPSYNIVGATPKIRQPFSRHIFNGVFPSAATIATSFVQEALRSQSKKVAIITGTYELPQALLQSVEPKLKNAGVEIATKQSFDLGAKDFTAQLIEAARTKPDVIIFIGHYTEAAPALRQAPELGAKNARDGVGSAAGSLRHDEPDRPVRVLRRRAGRERAGEEQQDQTKGAHVRPLLDAIRPRFDISQSVIQLIEGTTHVRTFRAVFTMAVIIALIINRAAGSICSLSRRERGGVRG